MIWYHRRPHGQISEYHRRDSIGTVGNGLHHLRIERGNGFPRDFVSRAVARSLHWGMGVWVYGARCTSIQVPHFDPDPDEEKVKMTMVGVA
jgi:hypothetical protein